MTTGYLKPSRKQPAALVTLAKQFPKVCKRWVYLILLSVLTFFSCLGLLVVILLFSLARALFRGNLEKINGLKKDKGIQPFVSLSHGLLHLIGGITGVFLLRLGRSNYAISLWTRRLLTDFVTLNQNIWTKGARFGYGFSQRINGKLGGVDSSITWPSGNQRLVSLFQKYLDHLAFVVKNLEYQPKFSVLIPVYKVEQELLRETLNSVCSQVYANWEICLVDDASNDERLLEIYKEYQEKLGVERFKYLINEKNIHISGTSNKCLQLAEGDYVIPLDHDDRLCPNSLAEAVRYINLHQSPEILYSDERTIESNGAHLLPAFYKPDFSPFLLQTVNYVCHMLVVKRALMVQVGGFRVGFEGAQDHDLILRLQESTTKPIVHIPMCLYEWRATEKSTARNIKNKSYAIESGVRAVQESLDRRGRPAKVKYDSTIGRYKINFSLPSVPPLISIIVPTRDQTSLLRTCLHSICKETSYPNYEIIVLDNDSSEEEMKLLLREYSEKLGAKFRVVRCSGPFNFNALNNTGAQLARGEFLVLLNNDTEIISPDWLEELWGIAQWPEIGAVGAKLLYPTGQIQHAGVALLGKKVAGHFGVGLEADSPIYQNMVSTIHEVSAVTGACLMVAKKKFLSVGGLDEKWIPNGWGDVDFCLKLRAIGLTNIYNPYATLYHHESKTRGISLERFELFEMIKRYGGTLLNDPYLNKNLNESYIPDPVFCSNDPCAAIFERNAWSGAHFSESVRINTTT